MSELGKAIVDMGDVVQHAQILIETLKEYSILDAEDYQALNAIINKGKGAKKLALYLQTEGVENGN